LGTGSIELGLRGPYDSVRREAMRPALKCRLGA